MAPTKKVPAHTRAGTTPKQPASENSACPSQTAPAPDAETMARLRALFRGSR